jgi:sigma-E factor negative regulatory protein RseA
MKKAADPAASRPDCEALSSLMDGELGADEARCLLDALCADAQLRDEWVAFHVVADALQSSEVAASHSSAFCTRLTEAIAREPAILAPRSLAPVRSPVRRYLAPGLAVAASAAVIGFVAVPLMRAPDQPAIQQAAVQAQPATPSASASPAEQSARRAAATVANARAFQAYLVAHRELTTGAALPRATPYLRTTGEQPDGR